MSDRVGVLFSLRDDPELVVRAEALGYESAWTAEGQGLTAFGKLERWATATEEIGLGTGIVNVFSRTPATTAAAAATLDAHSGGRAILGLGVASPGVVEGYHGVAFDAPIERMREYVELVRRYLRGDPDGFEGRFYEPRTTAFWDAFEPERAEIPIYNAALGERNVGLTGEVADGWLPNLYPDDRFDTAFEWLEAGAERTGRDASEIDVATYVLASVHEDPETARTAAAEHVAYYLRDIPGFYGRVARESGYGDDVDAARAADSLEAGARALSDEFVESVAVVGRPDAVGGALDDLRRAGVDLPIVRVPAGADRDWVERTLETFAPEE
jgi:alkanesulfonate monooxygenase SsuD/methylene tetrahydromethanopterin reductase-like flavin-dependent oxidoreductase (luciferase family)